MCLTRYLDAIICNDTKFFKSGVAIKKNKKSELQSLFDFEFKAVLGKK